MKEFILGYPKNSQVLTLLSNMQDANGNCSVCVGVFAENEEKARERFKELEAVNFDSKRGITGLAKK